MVSYAFTEGYYYHPRVDKELLRTYHEGIICCSACLGGELPQAIMHGGLDKAEAVVREFKEIFGDDYYLEMQLHRSGRSPAGCGCVRKPEEGQCRDSGAGGQA